MNIKQVMATILSGCLMLASQVYGDDTELYSSASASEKPNVLIIFDNSGSMATIETSGATYDPDTTYEATGSSNAYSDGMIYFTIGTGMDASSLPPPSSPSGAWRFNEEINACASAVEALEQYGRFTGYFREFNYNGNAKGTWQEMDQNSGADTNHPVDCYEDMDASNPDNLNDSYPDGYPQNSVKSGNTYVPWGDSVNDNLKNSFHQGQPVTLFTANYLRWYKLFLSGELETTSATRLDIAKDAIEGIISSMTSVNFGLAVFNMNYPWEGNRDGGRIVAAVKSRTIAEKQTLIDSVQSLDAETNTPLCETLYEAYRYFSGGAVYFGHADEDYGKGHDKYEGNTPPYDETAELSNGNYDTPLGVCTNVAYVIYITDGEPTLDKSADDEVQALTSGASSDGDYSTYYYESSKSSYLPALASYMYNNDQIPSTSSFQRVVTHTIGFALDSDSSAEPLLIETASRGGGQYFAANSVATLQAALSNVLDEVTRTGQHYSAPGVAVNNADPTKTLDSAYYAVFLPSLGPRWAGNLKKFKVSTSGSIVDVNGNNAINSDGGIMDKDNGDSYTACSVWSDCSSSNDGNEVEEGGVARSIDPDTRTILSDISSSGLVELTKDNASTYAGSDDDLASYMNISASDTTTVSDELTKAFKWIKGYNVDTDDEGEYTSNDFDGVRGDIMGDPLHSRPLVIDYSSGDTTDIRIFVGTNEGFFHAFKDEGSTVSESWAFLPYELLPNIQTLRDNSYADGHNVYGMDGSPVAYTERNSSGTITKAWVFVGMRRGGSSYYAFDVTNPDSPSLMWHIDSSTTGFSELSQSWSTPVVTKIPDSDDPVVIFGGGYNAGYDSGTGESSDGRAIFVVDAETGTLKHTFGEGGDIAMSGLIDGIAAPIATLDSDSNGVVDRLYAADLGGNVWRVDMPSDDTSDWSSFELASLGGSVGSSSDRRFFNAPAIAQTYVTNTVTVNYTSNGTTTSTTTQQNIPFDAVALGSGNRADPLDTTTEDMFFVIQDRNIITQTFGGSGTATPDTIALSDLYDVTSTVVDTETENLAFSEKLGWYYNFKNEGEKSLSKATIYNGYVYFSSFTPAQEGDDSDVCLISSTGRLYTFGLAKGYRSISDEYEDICTDCIPSDLQIVTTEDGEVMFISGSGECDESGDNCTGTITPASEDGEASPLSRYRLYYHVNE